MENPTSSDGLGQAEIDRILAQPGAAAAQRPARSGGLRAGPGLKVERYDFHTPAILSEPELRRLRALHEDFARYLGARLSLYLRMEFAATVTKLATVDYARFTETLVEPTHLALFKVDPLGGIGLLDLNPGPALAFADRLLGGRGQVVKAERHLTEIEVALVEEVMAIVLEEWCGAWKSNQPLHPTVIGHEYTGRFLQTAAHDAVMLVVTLDCAFGGCTHPLQIAVPYDMIEPVVRSLQGRRPKESSAAAPRRTAWQAAFDGISVPVRAEWNAFEAPVREIAALTMGDIIELDPGLVAQTVILVNGAPKFVATAGLDGDRVAVQLTRKISPEEPAYGKSDGPQGP